MPAISLWQPWASAIFAPRDHLVLESIALKPDETRHWVLPERLIGKLVAIHAAKRDTIDERMFWEKTVGTMPSYATAFESIGIKTYDDLPRGCIIGTVIFGSPISTNRATPDIIARHWGNHSPDRYSWPVLEKRRFATPIPCIGRQGFFTTLTPQSPCPTN